ncbi:MAG: TonB system transport protein ExbD [Gammaproteobacteria bacterium]|nr:TonB system transport protein ExbD [Gammaproteobacteria bacterium]
MKKFDQINVIPFIDIMLVLLAIVLTTATFIAQGRIPLNLPEAKHAAAAQNDKPLEISIDAERKLYLDAALVHLLELDQRLAEVKTSQPIVLRVDASVPFSDFVGVLDLLQKFHLEQVSIVTVHKQ